MVPREGGHTQIPRGVQGACLPAWVSGSSVKGGLDLPASPTAPWDGLDLPARWRPGREPLSRAVQGPGISPPGGGPCFKKNSKSWDEVFLVWNC